MSNLQASLVSTRGYFAIRQFNDWLELLDNAIKTRANKRLFFCRASLV